MTQIRTATRRFGLSKSKITAFEQCPKKLWLATHRPELAEQDDGAEARFATGNAVGEIACALHPGGVMVDPPSCPKRWPRPPRSFQEGILAQSSRRPSSMMAC